MSVSFRLFLFLNSGDESSAEDESPTDAKFPMRAGKFVFVFFSSMKKKSSTPKRVSFFFFFEFQCADLDSLLWTKHSSVSLQEASPDEENEPSEGDSLLLKKNS